MHIRWHVSVLVGCLATIRLLMHTAAMLDGPQQRTWQQEALAGQSGCLLLVCQVCVDLGAH